MKALLGPFSDGVDQQVRGRVLHSVMCVEVVEQKNILVQAWAEVKKGHPEEVS